MFSPRVAIRASALRSYQEAVEAAFDRGVIRQGLVWPTGAGKTIPFAIARRGCPIRIVPELES
jgi:superfamily II DNA or RNA helicase